MVFKSKTMKKGGKVKKTQKRIRGGNVFSSIMSYLPGGKKEEHTTVSDTQTQPTQTTQTMQSMQQMQPVPPQQGGKKKYSKGRKGRKGGMLGMKQQQPPHQQPVHQQPVHQQSPQGFHFFNHPKQVQQPNSGEQSKFKKFLHEGEHALASAGHNVAQAARRTASAVGSVAYPNVGGSKRKSKKQRKTYKKKYSKAKKSRKMRR